MTTTTRRMIRGTARLTVNKWRLNTLEHLVYEPWRQWENWPRDVFDGFFTLTVERLPNALKKISVFEDFSDSLATILMADRNPNAGVPMDKQVEAVRVADPRVGAAFASRSCNLEQLSVSYLVNAEDFLGACLPSWTWPRLESLALTSQLLCHIRDLALTLWLYVERC
ncbi:hypothetical protein F5144DRAFT_589022 [Chaetomium tenue]|uniref:Uncharacterized protein n=1 Tax=Chaetomium tenue TaxID=1854479 RepID=A0ACB7PNZ7_9PEZI|nr:hypothetical protein F5144DRAFT_589022 [Chaetomium globosum]